jgi:hypothetical protein
MRGIPEAAHRAAVRNPYSAAQRLWIPGSLAAFTIEPRFARSRWLAPQNEGNSGAE